MKSIRRHLHSRLLTGLLLIWVLAGTALFITVRRSLTGRLDAELELLTAEVIRLLQGEHRAGESTPTFKRTLDFFVAGSGTYFQTWDTYGLFSDRSPSLGNQELPRPREFTTDSLSWGATLESGERVRVCAARVELPNSDADASEPYGTDIVVAVNRDGLAQALSLLVLGILLTGVITALLCTLLVSLAVQSSLSDLVYLGAQCGEVGVNSDATFSEGCDLPAELQPIATSLDGLLNRLRESFERERRFSSDVAHELRTPVAELKTIAECALRWPGDERSDSHDDVLAIADQMEGLIEALLAVSRFENTRPAANLEAIDAAALLRECWSRHEAEATSSHLEVDVDAPDAARTEADQALLTVIFENLLSNAVEYTPGGGAVSIRLTLRDTGILLEVANTVVGLTGDDVEHLFERFWRAEESRSDSRRHGLGLSLAKLCAEAMGWRITASLSAPGDRLVLSVVSQD